MYRSTRRHAVRLVSLILLLAGFVTLLGGCSRSRNSSPSGSERITVSVEQAAAVLSVQSSAAEMYSGGQQGRTASTAQQVGEWLRKQGGVSGVEVSESGTIWVEYSCGLLAVILSPNTGANPEIWNGAPSAAGSSAAESTGATQGGVASLDPASASRGPASSDLTPTSKRAAVFAFDEYRRPSGDLRSALRQAGYTLDDEDVFVGEAFTVESLRTLGAYGVVYFNTHAQTENSKSGGYTILCTGQKATPEIIHGDWDMFVSGIRDFSGRATHGIGVATVPGANPPTHWLMITNRFLYLNGVELQNTLIMNNACLSLKNADMAESFLNAGAAMYVGWTNTSDCRHAEPMSAGLIRALSGPGTTFADAWSTKAIALSGWSEAYSAAELFPMVALKDSNGNGSPAYIFRNGVRWGDPADTGAEYGCSLVYTPQVSADRFVLVPRSSEGTPKLSLTGGSLPEGQASAPYSTNLPATRGVAPLSWRVTSGILPGGLVLDGTSGTISGTPTKAGTSTFSVEVSDSSSPEQTATAQFSLAVSGEVATAAQGPVPGGLPSPNGGETGNVPQQEPPTQPNAQQAGSPTRTPTGCTLLVWAAYGDDNTISACRIGRDGEVLDASPIVIARGGWCSRPTVCFGRTSWLVVWRMDDANGDTKIRAARVSLDGTVADRGGMEVGSEGNFNVGLGDEYRPSSVWTGSEWLVIYAVAVDDSAELVFQAIGEAGDVLTGGPRPWGGSGVQGMLVGSYLGPKATTFLVDPICLSGRLGYLIVATGGRIAGGYETLPTGERVQQGGTCWDLPRVDWVSPSGSSSRGDWVLLEDGGGYQPVMIDDVYSVTGAFGATGWLVVWGVNNGYADADVARLARLEETETGVRVSALGTLARQQLVWEPGGLSVASSGASDDWLVTWIVEDESSGKRVVVAAHVDSGGRVGEPESVLSLSSDENCSDNTCRCVELVWNGSQYIVSHIEQISGRQPRLVVRALTESGIAERSPTALQLDETGVFDLAAASDRVLPAPVAAGETTSTTTATSSEGVSHQTSDIVGEYYEAVDYYPVGGEGVLEIEADGTFFWDYLGIGMGDTGTWSKNGTTLTLQEASGAIRALADGGVVLFDPMFSLSLVCPVWVRRGTPEPSASEVAGGYSPDEFGLQGRLLLKADGTYEVEQQDSNGENVQDGGEWVLSGFVVELRSSYPYVSARPAIYAVGHVYFPSPPVGALREWHKSGPPAATTTAAPPSTAVAPPVGPATTPATSATTTTPSTTPVRPATTSATPATTTTPSTTPVRPATTSATPATTTTPSTTPVRPATTSATPATTTTSTPVTP